MPTVQARLDEETTRDLLNLSKRLGWSRSEVIREGIRTLASLHPPSSRSRIVGIGEFASGVTDLGSNKKRLRGFGR